MRRCSLPSAINSNGLVSDSENPPSPSQTCSPTLSTSSVSKRRSSDRHATAAFTKHVAESARLCDHWPPRPLCTESFRRKEPFVNSRFTYSDIDSRVHTYTSVYMNATRRVFHAEIRKPRGDSYREIGYSRHFFSLCFLLSTSRGISYRSA